MTREQQWDLADKWRAKARQHEEAMRDYGDEDEQDEEYYLHKEVAETLRQCARELIEVDQPKLEEIKF